MIASHDLAENKAVLDLIENAIRDHKIVDTPTDVLLSRLHHIAPPGIFNLIGIERAEGICEARREKLGEFSSFFVGKARAVMVRFGILEVDLLVRNVYSTTIIYINLKIERIDIYAYSLERQ